MWGEILNAVNATKISKVVSSIEYTLIGLGQIGLIVCDWDGLGELMLIWIMIKITSRICQTWRWCYCTPADIPTRRRSVSPIGAAEVELNDVACAGYGGWQEWAAALFQQGWSVTVGNLEGVAAIARTQFNVKCTKL